MQRLQRKQPPAVRDVVDHLLQRARINFLAIDFDQTVIDIHTGGLWRGSLEEIIPHVRPAFRELIIAALDSNAMRVAIVTFSRQPLLIQRVLESTIGVDRAAKVVIRGNDDSWAYEGRGARDGKLSHMASAVEELEQQQPGVQITKSTTLLIDDDKRNVKIALENGVRAVLFLPDRPDRLLFDLNNLP